MLSTMGLATSLKFYFFSSTNGETRVDAAVAGKVWQTFFFSVYFTEEKQKIW